MMAYRLGCKGITIYRDGSRESQVLQVEGKKMAVVEPAETKVKEGVGVYKKQDFGLEEKIKAEEEKMVEKMAPKIKPRPRPDITKGMTKKYNIGGCGKLYVTVNSDDFDICEVFTNTGEEGCAALSEAVSRLISITIRSGIDIDSILKQVEGIRCITCIADNSTRVLSCPDAIGKAIEYYVRGSNKFDLNVAGGPKSIMICPEENCGGIMQPEGGCYVFKISFSECQ
jgi:ribonucleoside-diphosphate reductase alpha chain